MRSSVQERFEAKVIPVPHAGCWLWTASENGNGYGAFHALGETRAHRVSYRLYKGEIPEGMVICHTCDTRLCVNPDHLFLGTQRENMLDASKKGRLPCVPNSGRFGAPGRAYAPRAPYAVPHDVAALVVLLYRRGSTTSGFAALSQRFGIAASTLRDSYHRSVESASCQQVVA